MMDIFFRKTFIAKHPKGEIKIKAYSIEGAKNKLRDLAITVIARSQGSLFIANVNEEKLQKDLALFEISEQP